MSAYEYQIWSRETAIYPKEQAVPYLALGLASEAGEVAGKVKKQIRDGGIDVMTLVDEVGDVLWYTARLCDELNFSMDEVMKRNREKLEDRKKRNVIGGSGDSR